MPANAGTPLHERGDTDHEPEGNRKRVGEFLEHRWVEVLIVVLIILDVVFVTVELAIDHNYACIEGTVVPGITPPEVVAAHDKGVETQSAGVHLPTLLFLQSDMAGTAAWGHGFPPLIEKHTDRMRPRQYASLAQYLTVTSPDVATQDSSAKVGSNETKPTVGKANVTKPTVGQANVTKPNKTKPEHVDVKNATAKYQSGHERGVAHENPVSADATRKITKVVHKQEPKHESHEGGHEGHHEGHHEKSHEASHHGGGHHEDGHGHGHGHHGHHPEQALVCETKYGHSAHTIHHTCHMFSIAILVIFLIELLLKMWIAPKAFFADWLHILDLFVVVTSLVIDIYVSYLIEASKSGAAGKEAHDAATIATLLVILRLWRVVRIAHGFNEIRNIELEKQHKELEDLEEKKNKEKAALEAVIKKHGLEDEVERT